MPETAMVDSPADKRCPQCKSKGNLVMVGTGDTTQVWCRACGFSQQLSDFVKGQGGK